MSFETTIYIIVFLFGLAVGSFLNVLIFRLPKHENIVVKRSHCMNCGYQLKWYDLVPLFSYLFLAGKCRKCKQKISIQYPLVELSNGGLWFLVFWLHGISLESVLICLVSSFLLVLSVIDARIGEIPSGLCYAILILGVVNTILDRQNWLSHVIGFIAVSLFFYLIIRLSGGRAMGGGDVRLMAAAGLFLGWQNVILAMVLGCIVGSVIHIILMAVLKLGRELKFGPYLSIGIWIAMMYGSQMISAYLSLFKI